MNISLIGLGREARGKRPRYDAAPGTRRQHYCKAELWQSVMWNRFCASDTGLYEELSPFTCSTVVSSDSSQRSLKPPSLAIPCVSHVGSHYRGISPRTDSLIIYLAAALTSWYNGFTRISLQSQREFQSIKILTDSLLSVPCSFRTTQLYFQRTTCSIVSVDFILQDSRVPFFTYFSKFLK